MDIINRYFNFKKKNLLDYTSVFFDDQESAEKYLREFINTYINTYYFHILDTYYKEEVTVFNDKVIIKEIKGKQLELIEEANQIIDEEEKKKTVELIMECYRYCFIAIIMDLTSYTYCYKLNEFKDLLKETLVNSRKLIEDNDEIIEKLSVLVKDNVIKERKFFVGLRSDTFNINYYSYRNSNINHRVELEYNIDQLQKNYTPNILEKNYKNEKISLEKFIATINLVETDILNKILRNKTIKKYFIECPLSSIKKRDDLEQLIKRFDNPRTKENIIFIVNYNDYISNKSMFKNLKDFKFALMIDLSRTIVIDKKLAEIEGYDLFSYIIINGLKKEDYQLVENYVIKGKEMFMNELNMM